MQDGPNLSKNVPRGTLNLASIQPIFQTDRYVPRGTFGFQKRGGCRDPLSAFVAIVCFSLFAQAKYALEWGRFTGISGKVETPNAFIGKTEKPTPKDLAAVLRPSALIWEQLISGLATDYGISDQEWSSPSPKYGWSLKLKLRKRTIVYLGPCAGCFRASFVLGDRAVAAAREGPLSAAVLKLLEDAPHFAEGTGLRLMVKSSRDLPSIVKLVQIKLAN
jgi:hypothetical protein